MMTSFAASCPTCSTALFDASHENVIVQACPRGHGLFIDPASLTVAIRDHAEDRPTDEEQEALAAAHSMGERDLGALEAARTCPMCSRQMDKRNYAHQSGVVMDVCDDHGIWLDLGELQRIESWSEAHGALAVDDRAVWSERLDAIERQQEEHAAADVEQVHWGPVGRVLGELAWRRSRVDDEGFLALFTGAK